MRWSEASAWEKSSDQLNVTVKGDRLTKSDDAVIFLFFFFFFFFFFAFWRQQLNIKTQDEHSRNSLLTQVKSNAIRLERNIKEQVNTFVATCDHMLNSENISAHVEEHHMKSIQGEILLLIFWIQAYLFWD